MQTSISVFTKPWKDKRGEELAQFVSGMGLNGVEYPVRDGYEVHPGNALEALPELARVLSPKVSLIGVGKNSYGHPTDDAHNALESVGSEIYRSDQDGDVVCTFSPDTITVDSQNKR